MVPCIIFILYISEYHIVEAFSFGGSNKPLLQSAAIEKASHNFKHNYSPKHEVFDTVRGAQCYLPNEQRIQRWIQEKWRELSENLGFQEYSMSVLAPTKIFENLDPSAENEHFKELYTFKDVKGRQISLRGDATPQFMWMIRRFIDDESQLPSSITKLYAISDCWRYERPSYCRRRNHLQWNVDIIGIFNSNANVANSDIGISNIDAEVELIYLLVSFLKSVGLSSNDISISLNHKDSTSALLRFLGFSEYSSEWFYRFQKILDKYKRVSKEKTFESLGNLGLTPDQCFQLKNLISTCSSISEMEKIFGHDDHFVHQLGTVYNELSLLGISDWVRMDLTIVRGNNYYTGVVFECFDKHNISQRAIAGGGRYNNYFGETENDERLKYSAGMGMGNIGIVNLLKERKLLPKYKNLVDIVVHTPPSETCPDSDQRNSLLSLVDKLRDNNISVYRYYKSTKLKKALEYANKCEAKFLLSPLQNEKVFLFKDLNKNEQEMLRDTTKIVNAILERLNN